MRKVEITINGTVEFCGREYDYRAVLRDPEHDATPSQVTDIDCSDGSPVPDEVDFETLEELAMQNAELLDWCEREGWIREDNGGGCSALIRAPTGIIERITREGDPSAPQTMSEPVAFGRYNWIDELFGAVRIFKGGINQWIKTGGYKPRKPLKEPKPVLKDGVIYSGHNGMRICKLCASDSELYTGRTSSGLKLRAIPHSESKAYRAFFGKVMTCERGCTSYHAGA